MAAQRVAFYGGSFDPPHLGHLAVACAARDLLGLDRILFAPVGAQPLKQAGSAAGFEDRVAMTRLAIAGEPAFELSLIDAPRPDPSGGWRSNYTIETLERLHSELPAGTELFQLMGADSFRTLHLWRRSAEIPFAATLIVASRPGEPLDDLARTLPEGIELSNDEVLDGGAVRRYVLTDTSGRNAQLFLLPGLHVEISATAIRGKWRAVRKLLPASVAEYIESHRLYRSVTSPDGESTQPLCSNGAKRLG